MRRSLLCTALLLATALLAGCGNKGPLVLPPGHAGSAVSPATSVPAPPVSSDLPG